MHKILIVGFGSIGKRHARNLLALDVPKQNIAIVDPKPDGVEGFEGVQIFKSLKAAPLEKFDIAFICTPTHLHIAPALEATEAGLHLFIEKPLSHSMQGIVELVRIAKRKKLVTMVGCNMRFHPCLQFLKKFLDSGKLGKTYRISLEMGHYLPYWQPGRDYTKSFRAKKETGGGIILDDVHEFDLLFWLVDFSPVKKSSFIYDRVSDLKINTEDIALAIFQFKNGIMGSVFCDFLQQPYSRGIKIVGEKGNLEWDFKKNIVWLKTKENKKRVFEIKNYDLNKMYIEELKHFFEAIQKQKKSFNDLDQARDTLKKLV